MRVYAIIPARSGSKGLPGKNIQMLAGKELMAYSIEFAKKLSSVTRVICSTDSEEYAGIARSYGADVPFLRSQEAAGDTAMEEDILLDLHDKFKKYEIEEPDLLVWLRPTFVFRNKEDVELCINKMKSGEYTACRTVTIAENRLYTDKDGFLAPAFNDHGKSMIRRQDVEIAYRVYSTDVFYFNQETLNSRFLGDRVGYVVTDKLCGLDIDDALDFAIVESLIEQRSDIVNDYL